MSLPLIAILRDVTPGDVGHPTRRSWRAQSVDAEALIRAGTVLCLAKGAAVAAVGGKLIVPPKCDIAVIAAPRALALQR